ncbi:tRNA (adenosine(37)-N6)-threonylcarbamoyltransferase complex ATPase subunit type 1 TsaE [Candidatus Dependentiae bacterium]|nr:tRNA (adenosine(37)-N6)-threonylcarbamoyltransferase complex ATPase subunit type 1 TsaE [Candidatus Dependentiae bacterium]
MKNIAYNLDQIESVATQFILDISDKKIVAFVGGLGAGKTTFIRAVLQSMGVSDTVISPTFTYFNQYYTPNGLTIYHFDLYRLKSLSEFEAAGFFEYLYQPNSMVFIEWPEIIEKILKDSVCSVKLSVLNHSQRLLEYHF